MLPTPESVHDPDQQLLGSQVRSTSAVIFASYTKQTYEAVHYASKEQDTSSSNRQHAACQYNDHNGRPYERIS